MRLYEITNNASFWLLLTEDARIQYILQTYGDKLANVSHDQQAQGKSPEELVNTLATADPSKNKQYLQFIVRSYVTGQFRLEDVGRINKHLSIYDKLKPRLPVNQRDIMKFKKLSDLYQITRQAEASPDTAALSNKQVKRQAKDEGVEVIMNTPNFKVYNMLTKEAACLYGKGTEWCTAATESENQFDYYKKQGNIYVIIAGNRKFQLHMESDQFMNENDEDIAEDQNDIEYLSKFPEYTQLLNMLIKKYYIDQNA